MVKRAACVLIDACLESEVPYLGQRYLAVTRKKNPAMFGLPGGKVDPGETDIQAAVRETFEETGIVLEPEHLVPIYTMLCPGSTPYWVTTFYYDKHLDLPAELVPVEDGVVPFRVLMQHLADSNLSPFAAYNCGIAGAIALYKLMKDNV